MEGQDTLRGCLYTWLLANEAVLKVETWKCDKERNLFIFMVFLMWGWCWDCSSPIYTLQNTQISYGRFLSISKASSEQCLERLLILFLAGRKFELGQGIEAIGGSFLSIYGGLPRKKEMKNILRMEVTQYKRLNSTVLCYFVFGAQSLVL